MKKFLISYLVVILSLFSLPTFAQADQDTAMLGLAGDNLDLYAVLSLFQKSKTIETFEKSLNEEKGINNLDLNLDKKIDFIKVTTKQKDSSFSFIMQVDISKTETQDVAVILVDKKKDKKVSIQIVGDELLYGKDYVIEPKGNSPVTANPGYAGTDPVPVNVVVAPPATIVVEQAPIVQYVYSPAYVPYVPPYYYGFYPPYFAFGMCIAVGIYRANTWGYHGGYHGGHYGGHNTVIINNNNNFNNYNNNKSRSNTVNDNMARGNYGDGRGANGNRGDGNRGNGNRGGPSASTRPANGAGGGAGANRPSTGGPSASTRPSTGADRPGISGGGASASTRPTTNNSPSTRQSSATSSRTRSGGGGGGFSGGGGGGRGGGGGGGRRR